MVKRDPKILFSNSNRIKFADKKIWVNWKIVLRDGKPTKIPTQPNGAPADSTDPTTWSTYAQCKAHDSKVGFVLSDELSMVGIDLDKCLDTDGEIINPDFKKLYERTNTYTEISPSGTGLHILLRVPTPFALTAMRSKKQPGFEVYAKGRYLTYTANPYKERRSIRAVSHDEVLSILKIVGYPWGATPPTQEPVEVPRETLISENDLIQKMFASKNGDKVKRLYDGDSTDYNNDESSADMAFLAHLAYWTGKDPHAMRSIWLSSPRGQRKKTKTRSDYQGRSIRNAIQFCTDVYTPPPAASAGLDLIFTLDSKGNKVFPLITENISRLLRKHAMFQGRFRLDDFKSMMEIRGETGWRQMQDADALMLQKEVSSAFQPFQKIGKEMAFDAMFTVATENRYDSAMDFIRGIAWDKQPRIDTWLSKVYGVPETAYYTAVGSNWLKGLVKRITEPGCKFDYVLVLEGPQGIKKSTSLAILGGDWHVETTMSTDTKDFFQQFQGKAIIEFSEGEILSKTETKRLKAIITMQYDRFRPSYGRMSVDFPRRCVFAMTTNQEEYLKDESGNRRWLPVACIGAADVEWLKANRDQLFAEAYFRVASGETVWEFPEDETRQMQEDRRISDPNADVIVDWYMTQLDDAKRREGVTVEQTFKGAILKNIPSYRSMSVYDGMNVSTVLQKSLHLQRKRSMLSGIRCWRYYPSDTTERLLAETPRTEYIAMDFGDFKS